MENFDSFCRFFAERNMGEDIDDMQSANDDDLTEIQNSQFLSILSEDEEEIKYTPDKFRKALNVREMLKIRMG